MPRTAAFLLTCVLLPSLAVSVAASAAVAAAPQVTRLSVGGLQVGGTTHLVVEGSNLIPSPRLVAGVPITSQAVRPGATPKRVEFDVTLAADVIAGVYHLRLASRHGSSPPQLITVDHLPQRPLLTRGGSLPVAWHGRLAGSTIASTTFTGKKGQPVTIDVMARRLGSSLRPVVHLADARGRPLGLSLPRLDLAGDARITSVLPADGTYTVRWHDLQYAAGNPGHYRVAIGNFETADLAFPAAVTRGRTTTVRLLGPFGREHKTSITPSATADGFLPVAWQAGTRPAGLRPLVQVSSINEVVETPGDASSRLLQEIPVAANGRLAAAGESDTWLLDVKPGDKLRLEVFADRIGTPLDSLLELKKPGGAVLASNDDAARADSRLDFTVPAGLKQLEAVVRDVHRRGGPRFIYRLLITRLGSPPPPGFDLTVAANTYNVLPGGRHVLRVDVVRRGYAGAIRLSAKEQPDGFELLTPEIPAGAPGALVTLRHTGPRQPQPLPPVQQSVLESLVLEGMSVGLAKPIVARVRTASHPIASLQPWLRTDLAVSREQSPPRRLEVEWGGIPQVAELFQGRNRSLPVILKRGPEAVGPIRLSLVTSQAVPRPGGKANAALAIRGTRATVDIPLAANTKTALAAAEKARAALAAIQKKLPADAAPAAALKQELDKARATRDQAVQALRKAVAGQKPEASYEVATPVALSLSGYDLAIRAELRSLDNKTVIARAYSPVRRFAARRSLEIGPSGNTSLVVARPDKTEVTVWLVGEIVRRGGFAGDVTFTLSDTPKGIVLPKVVVKAPGTRYRLALKLPAQFAATRIDNLKIVATGPPDPKAPKAVVQAQHVVSLVIGSADTGPPPPPPLPRTRTK